VLRPAFIVDISSTWEKKRRSLECYPSQFPGTAPSPTVLERVDAADAWWGSMIGVARGEPFTSREPIGLRGFGDLFLYRETALGRTAGESGGPGRLAGPITATCGAASGRLLAGHSKNRYPFGTGRSIRLWSGSREKPPMPSNDINVIALVKGGERYVFLYDDDSRAEALRVLGRFAANPDLSFSWYDASVLGQKVRLNTPRSNRMRIVPPADRAA
jgi:hypothetical protein